MLVQDDILSYFKKASYREFSLDFFSFSGYPERESGNRLAARKGGPLFLKNLKIALLLHAMISKSLK